MNVFRALVKAVVPASLRTGLRFQLSAFRERSAIWWLRCNYMPADAWLRDRLQRRRRYVDLSDAQARARRKSDTVFIFGSGYSLHDLTAAEWAHISAHDVLGFNQFFYERWVRADFLLLKGGFYPELRWRPWAQEVQRALQHERRFGEAGVVVQPIGAIVQARMGSTRLPGKSLRVMASRPLIHTRSTGCSDAGTSIGCRRHVDRVRR